MKHTPRNAYFVMVAWLLVGPTIRIVWQVQAGRPVDALPIISILIALGALALVFRPHRPSGPRRTPEP